jgi:integrase
MQWNELDLERGMWVIPGTRMKGRLAHDVPLVPEVLTLLRAMDNNRLHEDFVFPNTIGTGPLSDVMFQTFFRDTGAASDTEGRAPVPHGCRACFRGWCDVIHADERLAERQLAHRPRGQTAQAYQRETLFASRKNLLVKWTGYLHGRLVIREDNVIPLTAAG